jgi:outer membrane lipoprotein LolB
MRLALAIGVRGTAVAAVAALVGCATAPTTSAPPVAVVDAFEMTGRFAARQGDDAGGGRITWRHTQAEDDLMVFSPLGQGLARITRRNGVYVLEAGEDRRWESTDAAELAERALGFSIPVQRLSDWVLARPVPGGEADVQRDAEGRVQWIRQDGWKIEYPAYSGILPQRIRVSRADFELRLSIDSWRLAN